MKTPDIETKLPDYENYYLSKKDGKAITRIPPEVCFEDGTKLTYLWQKGKWVF